MAALLQLSLFPTGVRIHASTSSSDHSSSDEGHSTTRTYALFEQSDGPEMVLTGAALIAQPMSEVRVVVTEGKHRMVRRILHNCGHSVLQLHRTRYGPISLVSSADDTRKEKAEAELAKTVKVKRKTVVPDRGATAGHHRQGSADSETALVSPLKEGCIRALNFSESDWVNAIMRGIVLQK